MLENNRDEINYHKFLKSVRKSQNLKLEEVAMGVCCTSGMCRIESGSRLPDKLVRDRLTARLGISGEKYEEYLLPREYEQWELRMDILRCINKKDIESVEEKIAKYANLYNNNSVESQFIAAMRFMVYEMKGCPENILCEQIKEALDYTIADMDAALEGAHLLADQELNIIMEYIRLNEPKIPEKNVTEWRLEKYHKIVKYVEKSHMDKLMQAKVYSKLACYIAELVISGYATEASLRYALELCTRAIEVLRDKFRLYYFVELNEYRMKLSKMICVYVEGKDEIETLNKLCQVSEEWANLLCQLYTESDVPIYMQNFTYLYTETVCNNVRDVIRARRSMLGMSRRKFSGSACDERTLMRIELEQGNPSMVTVREIFDKIGLCAEYKRARLITSDAECLFLCNDLFVLMDNYRDEEAYQCIEKLYERIDMDICYNEQELRRQEVTIARRKKKVSNEELIEQLTDALECTLSLDALKLSAEMYFTHAELSCIHDFAVYTVGYEQLLCRKILEEMCDKAMEQELLAPQLYVNELIMTKVASVSGNEGNFDKSNRICDKLLKECLDNRRMFALTECIYGKLWNYQQKTKKTNDSYSLRSLNIAYSLSIISKQDGWKDFFQRKFNLDKTK